VDHALVVRRVERAGHLRDERHRGFGRQRTLPVEELLEIGGVHVAHGDEQVVAVLPRLVHRDDVRVVDRGQAFGLVHEAAPEGLVLRELGGQDLEGHVAF